MAEPLRLPMSLPPAPAEHPDVAYTDPAVARAHVEYLGRRYCLGTAPLVMWEPFAGGGAYMDAWKHCRHWDTVVAGDRVEPADWISGRLPDHMGARAIRRLLRQARSGVSLLLVGCSIADVVRGPLWSAAPPDELCVMHPSSGGSNYQLVTWFRRAGQWNGRMRLARYNWRTGQMWGRG